MKNLFYPVVAEDKLNPDFKKISSWPGAEPGRLMTNYIFQNYNDKDGNFIEQFQTTGFDARIFELYLFALFSNSGYEIIPDYARPDFLIKKDDITVAIEATTVNPSYGKNKTDIEAKITPDNVEIKHDHELPIKFGSPLFSKLNKKYWELEHCKNIPIVFAIEAFHEKNSFIYSDHGIAQYLFGLKDTHKRDKNGNLIIDYEEIIDHQFQEKTIPSNFFAQPCAEYISAVVFTNSGTWPKFSRMGYQAGYHRGNIMMIRQGTCYHDDRNSVSPLIFQYNLDDPVVDETWEQGLVVMHNPNALYPLPRYFLKCSAVHFFEDSKVKTECLPFHPFGSTTINSLLEDAHKAITVDINPNIVSLLKSEFENYKFERMPGPDSVTEEKEWFSDRNNNILGIVFRDKIDNDYGYLVLGKNENDFFSTIDVEINFEDRSTARNELYISMEKHLNNSI